MRTSAKSVPRKKRTAATPLESDKMTWMIIFSILLFCAQFDELNSCQRAKLFSDVGLTKVSSYFLNKT